MSSFLWNYSEWRLEISSGFLFKKQKRHVSIIKYIDVTNRWKFMFLFIHKFVYYCEQITKPVTKSVR